MTAYNSRKREMMLTMLDGSREIINLTTLHKIVPDGKVTRLYFQSGQQISSIVVRESLEEMKRMAAIIDGMHDTHGTIQ